MSDDEVRDRVRQIVSDVFNVPLAQVGPDATPETIAAWDSLHHLNLVMALEERFAMTIDPYAAADLVSVAAIVELIRDRT